MTAQRGAGTFVYGDLRDLPLRDLLVELDRLDCLLAQRAGPATHGVAVHDFGADALRCRERAIVAEIRRRPGGSRPLAFRRAEHVGTVL